MSEFRRIQTSFISGELSPRLFGRVDLEKYHSGCSEITNMVVLPQGGIQNRSGFRFIAAAKNASKKCRLVPFQYSTTQAYILEFGNLYIRFYAEGAQVVDGSSAPVEVTTTYTEAELPYLRFSQSADVLFICHPDHAPAMLSRTSSTSFSLADVSWTWPVFNSENTSAVTAAVNTASVGTGRTLTFSADTFSKGSAGLTNDHVGMYFYSYEYTGSPATATAKGLALVTAVTDATHATVDVLVAFNSTNPTTYWAEGTFGEVYGYPRLVTFYEDRLVFASCTDFPEKIWLSQTGDYYNFEYGTDDSDAIGRSINSEQVNAIVWMKSAKKLHYGTMGGEGHLSSGSTGAVTPTAITTVTESRYGSPLTIDPVLIGNETIFVQRPGKTVRRYSYDYESDSFNGENLSIMAEHLTMDATITEMAYQQEPYGIVWMVRSDGDLLGLTYLPEHKVVAWHRHTTEGDFESVAVIPGDTEDELWAVVKRTIGTSAANRYIERLDPFFVDDETEDAFFVDSGLTYDGSAATTISGLTHLIGESVNILGDGAAIASKTVSATGTILLPYSRSVVHVGLPYTCDMVTMPTTFLAGDGSVFGRKKRIEQLILRFYSTFGCKISADGTTYHTVHFALNSDNEVELFTGDKVEAFPGGWDEDAKMYIRQDIPLPFTLLALIPKYLVER